MTKPQQNLVAVSGLVAGLMGVIAATAIGSLLTHPLAVEDRVFHALGAVSALAVMVWSAGCAIAEIVCARLQAPTHNPAGGRPTAEGGEFHG